MGENNSELYKPIDTEDQSSIGSYLFFWIGQLFSLIGTSVSGFAITWWVTDVTENAMFLAIGNFLFLIFFISLTPIAGVVCDRYNRKLIIFIADSFNSMERGVLIILFYIGWTNPLMIVFINGLRGIGQAFHQPTVNAIIPSMVPKKHLSRINGVNYLFTSLIQVIGPMIGGIMYAFFPIELILWVDIITYGIALFPLILVRIPRVISTHDKHLETIEKKSFIREFKIGIKTIRLIPGLLTILLLSMFLNFLFQPLNILVPLYVKVDHMGNENDLAIVYALVNGGMILGGIITTIKKKWSHKVTVYFSGLIAIMSSAIIYAIAPIGYLFVASIVGAFALMFLPIVNTIYLTIMQTTVPKDKMGRITSVDHTLSYAIMPIGALMSGVLGVLFGTRLLFLLLGLIGVLTISLVWQFSGLRNYDYNDEKFISQIAENIKNSNG
ncbi:MAG: MFS transporter [Candidatus Lokiarchaeota archaeon]